MKKFRLFKRTRQSAEYSYWASALQAVVLCYWGKDLDDEELEQTTAKGNPVIVLFENLWERKFKAVARKYDSTVIDQRIIPSDSFDKRVQGLTGGR